MKPAKRRCLSCRKQGLADEMILSHLKAFCSMDCAMAYIRSDRGKKATEKAVKTLKVKKDAEVRQKLKTRSEWLREAQSAFNAYVRQRDEEKPCVSCGDWGGETKVGGGFDCGHLYSRGAHPSLRFNLHNVAKQCVRCNRYLSGNVAEFRRGLVARIGERAVAQLEEHREDPRHDIPYLKRVKDIFTKKFRVRQKIRNKKC